MSNFCYKNEKRRGSKMRKIACITLAILFLFASLDVGLAKDDKYGRRSKKADRISKDRVNLADQISKGQCNKCIRATRQLSAERLRNIQLRPARPGVISGRIFVRGTKRINPKALSVRAVSCYPDEPTATATREGPTTARYRIDSLPIHSCYVAIVSVVRDQLCSEMRTRPYRLEWNPRNQMSGALTMTYEAPEVHNVDFECTIHWL